MKRSIVNGCSKAGNGVTSIIVAAALLLCSAPSAAWESGHALNGEREHPDFCDHAVEGAAAFGVGLGFAVAPFFLTWATLVPASMGYGVAVVRFAVGLCATAVAYPLGSAAGANWAGNARGWSGSFGRSLGLALIPPALMAGCFVAGYYFDSGSLAVAGLTVFALATPHMAVVGYNLEAHKKRARGSLGVRFDPPTLSLHRTRDEQGLAGAGINCRLVTARF